MARQTIDVGIDLGTTNSAIAVLDDNGPRVVRNDDNVEFTPSAVWVRPSGQVYVGHRAVGALDRDAEDVQTEFKQRMGVSDSVARFPGSGRSLAPEELSAEVLRALRANVERDAPPVEAAVITIPAAFELHQSAATSRAAELAGLRVAPLLQEPTAAAHAYSHGLEVDRGFWLVYDFGGGTFDAAVISIRDGQFTVARHAGDNHLGGKRIDWDIVDEVFVPHVRRELGWTDFGRGDGMNPGYRGAFGLLKKAAEAAKVQLSSRDVVDVDLRLISSDGRDLHDLELQLTRAELERIAMPYYRRSVALCRRALEEARLGPGDVEKVLLVGGTTIAPAVRALLLDPAEGLGIDLDQSQDPVTVVARGAAVFAGTQLLAAAPDLPPPTAGQVRIEFHYSPQGDDPEPLVGGRLTGAVAADLSGHRVRFVDAARKPPWRGPEVPVSADGTFTTALDAPAHAVSTFTVELRTATGAAVPVTPETITYRYSAIQSGRATLPKSVGVAVVGEEVVWLVRKDTELPCSRTERLRTTVAVDRTSGAGVITVPVVQGERNRADRNAQVGMLSVSAREVARSVPAGSGVEVTVEIDESQRVTGTVFVPVLDQDWRIDVELRASRWDPGELHDEVAAVEARIGDLRSRAATAVAPEPRALLAAVDEQGLPAEVTKLAGTAGSHPDDAVMCQARCEELQIGLDDIEDALELPEVLAEIDAFRRDVAGVADPVSRNEMRAWDQEFASVRAAGDVRALQRSLRDLLPIFAGALDRSGQLESTLFLAACSKRDEMSSPATADRLIERGRRAMARGDRVELGQVNDQLFDLLPPEQRTELTSDGRLGRDRT